MKIEFIVYIGLSLMAIVQAYPAPSEDNDDDIHSAEQEAKNLEVLIGRGADETREGKCHKSCVMKQMKLLTPENKLAKTAVVEFVGKITGDDSKMMEAADKITDMCNQKVQDEDLCEAAHKYSECFTEAMKAIGDSPGN